MRKIQEILRLHFEQKLGQRQIARSANVSQSTVHEYLARMNAAGLRLPHAPNATPVWTVYTYDGSGRTISAASPDGSATTYAYQGNTVTVTDPAGKWKKFTMDAMGNLTSVLETDPTLGQVTTNYSYDMLNHLTNVSMPRGSTTQTRTFNYTSGTTVGAHLLSATNPENGIHVAVLLRADVHR